MRLKDMWLSLPRALRLPATRLKKRGRTGDGTLLQHQGGSDGHTCGCIKVKVWRVWPAHDAHTAVAAAVAAAGPMALSHRGLALSARQCTQA